MLAGTIASSDLNVNMRDLLFFPALLYYQFISLAFRPFSIEYLSCEYGKVYQLAFTCPLVSIEQGCREKQIQTNVLFFSGNNCLAAHRIVV